MKISDNVIACDLWFGPPPIKNPGYAYDCKYVAFFEYKCWPGSGNQLNVFRRVKVVEPGLKLGPRGPCVQGHVGGENKPVDELAVRMCVLGWWEGWRSRKEDAYGLSVVQVSTSADLQGKKMHKIVKKIK